MTLRVLSVASEAVPLVKTGGLADVAGALPAALAPHGVELTTLIPGYRSVMSSLGKGKVVYKWPSLLGQPARLLAGELGGNPLLVLDVISKGAAQSWQMENRGKTMNAGKFDFGFAVDWMRKDLGLVLDEARANGAHLAQTALMSPAQTLRYAELRGYSGAAPAAGIGNESGLQPGQPPVHQHRH